jgi:hypothetical protein
MMERGQQYPSILNEAISFYVGSWKGQLSIYGLTILIALIVALGVDLGAGLPEESILVITITIVIVLLFILPLGFALIKRLTSNGVFDETFFPASTAHQIARAWVRSHESSVTIREIEMQLEVWARHSEERKREILLLEGRLKDLQDYVARCKEIPEPYFSIPWESIKTRYSQLLYLSVLKNVESASADPLAYAVVRLLGNQSTETLDEVLGHSPLAGPTAYQSISSDLAEHLNSANSSVRAAALAALAEINSEDSFRLIANSFDDPSEDVRNAAAHALYGLNPDFAASFTRALREGSPERRRKIGAAIAGSGLATNAINNLTGGGREKTYGAFSVLFLMAKTGEIHPLMQAIGKHPNVEVRLTAIKLLALSNQPEVLPAFRNLVMHEQLPPEVCAAITDAIYAIDTQARERAPSVA